MKSRVSILQRTPPVHPAIVPVAVSVSTELVVPCIVPRSLYIHMTIARSVSMIAEVTTIIPLKNILRTILNGPNRVLVTTDETHVTILLRTSIVRVKFRTIVVPPRMEFIPISFSRILNVKVSRKSIHIVTPTTTQMAPSKPKSLSVGIAKPIALPLEVKHFSLVQILPARHLLITGITRLLQRRTVPGSIPSKPLRPARQRPILVTAEKPTFGTELPITAKLAKPGTKAHMIAASEHAQGQWVVDVHRLTIPLPFG